MSFEDDIRRASANITARHDAIVRGTTIALFNAVIMDTPVDTGRARGNWQTTVGQPATDQIEREGASASMAEAEAKIPKGAGQETMLANNLPYIEELENGSSKQASAGMVRGNMDRVSKIVAAAIEKNKV